MPKTNDGRWCASHTFGDMVKLVAEKADVPQANARRVIRQFLYSTEDVLRDGGSISLYDFGTFRLRLWKGRRIYNIDEEEMQTMEDTAVVAFNPSRNMQVRVRHSLPDGTVEDLRAEKEG